MRRSVSPYYALNITDRAIPLTSVVETTHVVDPEHVGGHLIYVPRYVRPGAPRTWSGQRRRSRAEYLGEVTPMFPEFQTERDVIASQVARARWPSPVPRLGVTDRIADASPAPGLVVASSARVYPKWSTATPSSAWRRTRPTRWLERRHGRRTPGRPPHEPRRPLTARRRRPQRGRRSRARGDRRAIGPAALGRVLVLVA